MRFGGSDLGERRDTNIVLRIYDRTDASHSSAVETLIAEAAITKDLLLKPTYSRVSLTLKRSYNEMPAVYGGIRLLLQSPSCPFDRVSNGRMQSDVTGRHPLT